MRRNRVLIAASTFAVLVATPATALNYGVGLTQRADTQIGIVGFVPVICHARVSNSFTASEPGVQSLGELREFCNSPRGYRVVADYSATLQKAKLIVDGKPVQLGPQGSTVVSRSNHAQIETRNLELDFGKKAPGGTISFRIEAL